MSLHTRAFDGNQDIQYIPAIIPQLQHNPLQTFPCIFLRTLVKPISSNITESHTFYGFTMSERLGDVQVSVTINSITQAGDSSMTMFLYTGFSTFNAQS